MTRQPGREDKGVQFEVYPGCRVTWDGEGAPMGGTGKAAWSRDGEGNTLCLDSGLPED